MFKQRLNIETSRGWVSEAMNSICNGSIVIPDFQRDFCWTTKNAQDLLDSMLSGIPIGTLTLLRGDYLDIKIDRKNVMVDPDQNDSAYNTLKWSARPLIVLDGAQRLQCLWKMLVTGEFRIYMDIFTNKIEVVHADEPDRLNRFTQHADLSYLASSFVLGHQFSNYLSIFRPKDLEYFEMMLNEHGFSYKDKEQAMRRIRSYHSLFSLDFAATQILASILTMEADRDMLKSCRADLETALNGKKKVGKQRLEDYRLQIIMLESKLKSAEESLYSAWSEEERNRAAQAHNLIRMSWQICQAFKDFEIGATVIAPNSETTIEDVIATFTRMNMAGVPVPIEFLQGLSNK